MNTGEIHYHTVTSRLVLFLELRRVTHYRIVALYIFTCLIATRDALRLHIVATVCRHHKRFSTQIQGRSAYMIPAIYASHSAISVTIRISRGSVSRTIRIPRHSMQKLAVLPLALPTQKITADLRILLIVMITVNAHLLYSICICCYV